MHMNTSGDLDLAWLLVAFLYLQGQLVAKETNNPYWRTSANITTQWSSQLHRIYTKELFDTLGLLWDSYAVDTV